jgi:hypothetical protein
MMKFESGFEVEGSSAAPQRTGSARHCIEYSKQAYFGRSYQPCPFSPHLFTEIRRSLRGAYPAAVVLARLVGTGLAD